MSHTPGPWHAPSAGIFAGNERVAVVEALRCPKLKAKGGTRNVEIAANAQLIAAAPEMLEIIQEAYHRGYFDEHPHDTEQEADEKERARALMRRF